jgi:hypothetical protein
MQISTLFGKNQNHFSLNIGLDSVKIAILLKKKVQNFLKESLIIIESK